MKIIRAIHTFWGLFVFNFLFLVLFPFLLIPIFFSNQFRVTGIVNRWWAKLMFRFVFIPVEIVERAKLDQGKQYIFCANHFSYLDIPTMGLNPVNAIFVGKNDMERVPLFGFMYRKLHITVDRENFRSRGNTVIAAMKAIKEGKSLVVFPEGGMLSQQVPQMIPFKDGAFRTAIEKQVPIVPVTIPFNWKILPDRLPMRLQRGKVRIVFHEPIQTVGMSLDDIGMLKAQTFQIIASELKQQNAATVVPSND
ncbi:MAG TPA: lysophospholipid acyltransferase family protein [Cyclobacteriaceae bacterium]|jgi:1-acyl-sn-glycerol-3-phosphate acyltransferase|nr:lysophospholipid acyltransferase family protein [Cyclobacteriaceae bacterium]